MSNQPAFPGLRDAMKMKQTRRELFLSEMEAVVPLSRLLGLITSHYPEGGTEGRASTAADCDHAARLFPPELVCPE
jgi:IS5 family transposase